MCTAYYQWFCVPLWHESVTLIGPCGLLPLEIGPILSVERYPRQARRGTQARKSAFWRGDSILFYSDGLVEARDPQHEMFGFTNLRALIAEQGEKRLWVDSLLEKLRSFTGEGWEHEDDITTLLALRRSPASG